VGIIREKVLGVNFHYNLKGTLWKRYPESVGVGIDVTRVKG